MKVLTYSRLSPEAQQGLNQSRSAEWHKWSKFGAVVRVPEAEARELIAQGVEIVMTQWVDTDKNDHLRVNGCEVDQLYKSRMVACGNQEAAEVRSDSPTAPQETLCLILSFAASHRINVRSADITNAYFHGE